MSTRSLLALLFPLLCLHCTGCLWFGDNSNPSNNTSTDMAGTSLGSGKQLGLLEVAGGNDFQTSTQYTSISLAFFEEPSTCTEKTEGGCTIKHCPPSPNALVYRRAGQVTIAGGLRSYQLAPTQSGAYGAVDQSGFPFQGGETVTLTAAGDLVPAFTIDAIAPFQVTVDQPAISNGALNVSASKALAVAWTGSPGGEVLAVLTRYSSVGEVTNGYCRFSGEAGTGALPQALIQTIAQAPGENISFGIISRNQTTKTVGAYQVQLNLTFAPTNASSAVVTFVP